MTLTLEKVVSGGKLLTTLYTCPIVCGYLLMVLCSRWWKKVAAPLDLKPVLLIYNFTVSATSLFTLFGFVYCLSRAESTFQQTQQDNIMPIFKIYWLMKIVELLDTVFIILKHKRRKLTLFHVHHHCSSLMLSELCYFHYPYPLFGVYFGINSMLHVVLYLYYGLNALYPDNPPTWKKQLTLFQILEMFTDMVHITFGYLYHGYCVYGVVYGWTLALLFSNFYYQTQIKKSRKAA